MQVVHLNYLTILNLTADLRGIFSVDALPLGTCHPNKWYKYVHAVPPASLRHRSYFGKLSSSIAGPATLW